MLLITQPRAGISHNEILSLHFVARTLGWDVYPAPTSWRLDESICFSKQQGVPYGSQTFCEVISQQMGWRLKLNAFDWLAKLPYKYVKRKISFMSLNDVKEMKYEGKLFIKPADDKCFNAKIYKFGEFKPSEVLSGNEPCLTSEVVEFTSEYRCFVLNGKVQTASCYLLDGEIASPKNWEASELKAVIEFVNKMLQEVWSENAVIDAGIIKDKGPAIIESNPAWASGIYGCDPIAVLQVMQQSCGLI